MNIVPLNEMIKKGLVTYMRKLIAGVALIASVSFLLGCYDGPQQLVETTYEVQAGDTLRDISEKFLPLNTGGRRYILEFEQGIVELNPELQQDRGTIYPGQKIRINYWVKE